ncbi:MAG TPA: bifunctional serine/threonine-protein kinase/formylglycine-generating enzyme family protein [Pirellulales bacterium]|nr:bifunctional serine/threonine-protein kinase/formylglycine-generating enzyme family protein [Pirellulales bacterium]
MLALRRYRKTLLASGLIDPAELRAFEMSFPRGQRPTTAEGMAEALIRVEKLTPFQAAEIAAGRAAGLVLGNYVLLDRIGAGGMGQVFKAWHRRMQRTVAIKMLPDQAAAGEASIARFRREILSAAQLLHPNIVAAYDADVAAGVHYLVMEYVAGQNLAERLRERGPLPVAQAVKYVLDAARGLAYAHARGLIHRDVKPSNLIVDETDVVKLLDLGLARPAAAIAEAELTSPGDVVGTLEYMAPEQATGAESVDGRADVYGLGCTLYRLVTGQLPYRGGSPQALIAAHRDQKMPSLCAAREDVPRPLDAIFKRMVAKKPDDRQQTMDEVVAALEKLRLNGRPKASRTSDAVSRRPAASSLVDEPSSGDDLELAPTAAGPHVNQGELGSPRASAMAGSEEARQTSEPPSPVASLPPTRATVSPLFALLTLAAALAGLTSLSWFESGGAKPSRPRAPHEPASAYQAAVERQRAWSQALGVPVTMTNSLGMRFALVPPDGSPQEASAATINPPFYFGAFEVTVAQYRQFLISTGRSARAAPAAGVMAQGDRHPATDLTPTEAEAFCAWLGSREGAVYRLPSELEFARASGAGTVGQQWFDNFAVDAHRFAWYEATSAGRTHQVGLLEANPLGLHDILGNAAEWCRASRAPLNGAAIPGESAYVLCGGSWASPLNELGATRSVSPAAATGGLRLVLELPLEARWPR